MNVLVSVPQDDLFGLFQVVTETTLDGDELSEVFASHGFLHPETRLPAVQPESMLRKGAGSKPVQFCRTLWEELSRIQ